ncbi:MAG: hypothetical protein J6M95_04040 [Bacilli bacterium]|nr:hypothetical protein [Bacilli bacterium]
MDKLNKEKPSALDIDKKPLTELGAQRLAAAIIESAVNDYRDAGFKLKRMKYKVRHGLMNKTTSYQYEVKRIESDMRMNKKFLLISPIVELMNIDGNWVIETLDKQIEELDPSLDSKGKKHG